MFLTLALSGSFILASLNPQQVFDRVRENITAQLKKAANYTCVLTTERDYFTSLGPRGCVAATTEGRDPDVVFGGSNKRLFMHDRLRLDVAVSKGDEIFSWHGGKKFSSGSVADIVTSGPISSGTFVGYLQNIFFGRGVDLRYRIPSRDDGLFHFVYDVPLRASHHALSTGTGTVYTPFHGEFSADTKTFELVELSAVVDRPPKRSQLCLARSRVNYQTIPVGSGEARVPSEFLLETEDTAGFVTRSHSTYQACRVFAGESTVNFNTQEDGPLATASPDTETKALPAGVRLSVALRTPVDDIHSFTGDTVEGVLMRPSHAGKLDITLPAGAVVSGVITQLERRYQPVEHYAVRIRLDSISFGGTHYNMAAIPEESEVMKLKLQSIYGSARAARNFGRDLGRGMLLYREPHLRLDRSESLEFITEPVVASAR